MALPLAVALGRGLGEVETVGVAAAAVPEGLLLGCSQGVAVGEGVGAAPPPPEALGEALAPPRAEAVMEAREVSGGAARVGVGAEGEGEAATDTPTVPL